MHEVHSHGDIFDHLKPLSESEDWNLLLLLMQQFEERAAVAILSNYDGKASIRSCPHEEDQVRMANRSKCFDLPLEFYAQFLINY